MLIKKSHIKKKKMWNRVTFIAVHYYPVTKHPNSLGAKIYMFFLHLFLKVQIEIFFYLGQPVVLIVLLTSSKSGQWWINTGPWKNHM